MSYVSVPGLAALGVEIPEELKHACRVVSQLEAKADTDEIEIPSCEEIAAEAFKAGDPFASTADLIHKRLQGESRAAAASAQSDAWFEVRRAARNIAERVYRASKDELCTSLSAVHGVHAEALTALVAKHPELESLDDHGALNGPDPLRKAYKKSNELRDTLGVLERYGDDLRGNCGGRENMDYLHWRPGTLPDDVWKQCVRQSHPWWTHPPQYGFMSLVANGGVRWFPTASELGARHSQILAAAEDRRIRGAAAAGFKLG